MILAGEPRAIDDGAVIVVIYAAWQVARLGRRAGPAAVSVAAGLVLGVCLGAVQWLPGLAAISTSQRDGSSMALFSSGSLPARWLLLTLVPDLLGGSGSMGQPMFVTSYNLTEVTSYVGILPLVAAFALLGRLRLQPRLPEWAVWHVTALAGVILALGGNTPLGGLLFRIPLFGDQRLQSRNVLVLDLALAVLLAYWADHPLAEGNDPAAARGHDRLLRYLPVRRMAPDTILGVVPALAAAVVVVLALTWGAGVLEWMGVGAGEATSIIGHLKPWLIPSAVLGAGAAALVMFGRALRPRLRSGLMAGFVVVDVLVFTVLCVVEVGHGISGGTIASPGASPGFRGSQAGGTTTARRSRRPRRARSPRSVSPGGSRSTIPTCSTPASCPISTRPTSTRSSPARCLRFRATPPPSTGSTRRRPARTRPPEEGRTPSPRAPWRTGRSTSSTPRSCSPRRSISSPARPGAARRPGRRAPAGATWPPASGRPGIWAARWRCPRWRCRTPRPGRTRRPGSSSG